MVIIDGLDREKGAQAALAMEVELSFGRLRPCPHQGEIAPCAPEDGNGGPSGGPCPAGEAPRASHVGGGTGRKRRGKGQRESPPSSASSSSSYARPWRRRGGGVPLTSRRRRGGGGGGSGVGDDLQGLALPLGMSFAAVVAQGIERAWCHKKKGLFSDDACNISLETHLKAIRVLDGKKVGAERIPVHRLSTICSLAVREAVENVYGERFDSFIRNFEKSFCSTLKTLHVIQEEYFYEQQDHFSPLRNCSEAASTQGNLEFLDAVEDIQENHPLSSADNQLILRAEVNQQLAHLSQRSAGSGFSQSVLSTLEKSVMEQARSNDLRAVEIGLTVRKLQLKKSQLDLSSYASFLEWIKISMGISKASFKEEKLKNQIKDLRHAELLRRCIDLLVGGLILMSCLLVYGAYIYSYRRISEATSSCMSPTKEPGSWWVPKQVASFSSGWLFLRCHVVVISRMFFGILMILAVAYALFQRAAGSGFAMPVTFILLLLGVACGTAGKFCVETLGGNGYYWLFYWEIYCLLHFFANAFPSALYYILHGPVSISSDSKRVMLPYWFRRFAFYTVLVLILPMLSGLLPFASLYEWQEHLTSKMNPLSFGVED